ncbi:hypothetical protein R5R35_007237 [Gryllus longicercus]|uniref:Uncharacterized protein n=1 Tax=Gryllus longicercus TaxID=2509291 RepID=A0AAN9VA06_9ORTH
MCNVSAWTGAGPCSDWTALDPAIMSSRPHSIFSSSSVTPQHPIILCNTNSVLNQQSPNTQYLHLQNTTHWLRSLASDGCLLYGANISQNMSNSDWTVQSHHSNSIAPPPPGFSLRMTTQQTAIQNKLAVSASQEITKIENI